MAGGTGTLTQADTTLASGGNDEGPDLVLVTVEAKKPLTQSYQGLV